MKQNFSAEHINQKWTTDFTYVFLRDGRVAIVRAVKKALENQKTISGNLILHSDQGTQYTSKEFTDYCASVGITKSMNKAGYPYDNAHMERYVNTLKNELLYLHEYSSE